MKDVVVNYSKSQNYYEKILETFPENKDDFLLKLYSEGDHDKTTTNIAIEDFLNWVGT